MLLLLNRLTLVLFLGPRFQSSAGIHLTSRPHLKHLSSSLISCLILGSRVRQMEIVMHGVFRHLCDDLGGGCLLELLWLLKLVFVETLIITSESSLVCASCHRRVSCALVAFRLKLHIWLLRSILIGALPSMLWDVFKQGAHGRPFHLTIVVFCHAVSH